MTHSVTQLHFIREIEGREVWVAVGDDVEQVILLEDAGWSGLLALALAKPEQRWTETVRITRDGGTRVFAAVPHTVEVDRFLIELIDALIGIRYEHPSFIQLPLALTEEEAAELKQILGVPVG